MKTKPTITADALRNFFGSEQFFYHPLFPAINYTEGVKYVSDNGAAWLITDILANIMGLAKLREQPFLAITLTVKDGKGVLIFTNGNDGKRNRLYEYNYDHTDFPLPEIKFFSTDGVLMLSSEY